MGKEVVSLSVFLLVYIVISFRQVRILNQNSSSVVLLGTVILVIFGVFTLEEAFSSIDVNTIVLLLGTMIFSAYVERTKFFEATSLWFISKAKKPRVMLGILMFVSGFFSSFFVNDTVCILLTPLVVAITRKINANPIPFLLGLVMSANIGSAMTLIGNPQNMIIATSSGLPFYKYFIYVLPMVFLSLLIAYLFILFMFRRDLNNVEVVIKESIYRIPQPYWFIIYRLGLLFLLFVFMLFLPSEKLLNVPESQKLPIIAITVGALAIVIGRFRPDDTLRVIDWTLILFFSGLFIVVEAVREVGIVESMYSFIKPYFGNSEISKYSVFSLITILGSNIVSNVPYVMIAKSWVREFVNPDKAYVLLAVVSTFAGNLTIIGSVANIIVLEKSKSVAKIDFWTYSKVGIPITIITSILAVIYITIIPF